jgi:hypothetical protein
MADPANQSNRLENWHSEKWTCSLIWSPNGPDERPRIEPEDIPKFIEMLKRMKRLVRP